MTDYKSYQQIISLTGPKAVPVKKVHEEKVKKHAKVQKRTKTGCLTCRKRKKKCDENTVDGKCQGCTRNFLECNWPFSFNKGRTSSVSSEASDLSTTSTCSGPSEPCTRAGSPFISSYPSPKSPRMEEEPEINHIKLPPLRFHDQSVKESNIVLPKVEFPKTETSTKTSKFIITSLSEDKLCSLHN